MLLEFLVALLVPIVLCAAGQVNGFISISADIFNEITHAGTAGFHQSGQPFTYCK